MNKKICVITTISKTMEWFVVDSMRFLSKNGYDVTLVCNMDEEFIKHNQDFAECIHMPMSRGINPFDAVRTIGKLYRLFRERKFDIVQYSTPNASLYASVAGFLSGVKVRLYCQWGLRYVSMKGISKVIFKNLERFTCCLSTVIEPDGYGNLKLGREEKIFSEKKSRVVWNGSASGVNLDKFDIAGKAEWRKAIRKRYGIPLDAYVFGFVGRIDVDKGFNEMLEAFQRIIQTNENVYLLFVGMKDKTEKINQELYKWSVKNNYVIYTDVVSETQMYISAMDILLLPSYREGFGSVVIEAGAMAVPTIASDIPGPRESVLNNKTGLLIPKKDANALYDCMVYAMNNPNAIVAMGNKARTHVQTSYNSKILFQYILADRNALCANIYEKRR